MPTLNQTVLMRDMAEEGRMIVASELRPDFQVRNLADYSTDDLNTLLLSVSFAYESSKKSGDKKAMNALDIWAYRIKDAIKEAAHYEELTNINE